MSEEKDKHCCPVGPRGETGKPGWEDLAPEICRQRMVVEGTLHNSFKPLEQALYCKDISKVLDMTPVAEPTTSYAEEYGWCCFMHWKESGMHIYSWDNRSPKFFSIDIYTCKKFDPWDVVRYTKEFFGDNLIKLTWKE
jgi:S-adenosylmethionine decarboxylase